MHKMLLITISFLINIREKKEKKYENILFSFLHSSFSIYVILFPDYIVTMCNVVSRFSVCFVIVFLNIFEYNSFK